MPYRPLPSFLFRAPLLPMAALARPAAALLEAPLGRMALELASADLAAALARGGRPAALGRYGRRAAFRPTPHGLLAGVGVGKLEGRTLVRTGRPEPVLRVAWSRLAALGRALAAEPPVREQIRLRRCPSLLGGAHTVLWLGPGPHGGPVEERRAPRDELLDAVLAATEEWTPWPAVRATIGARVASAADDPDAIDDLLLAMVDDGIVQIDLGPSLCGPEPGADLAARLGRHPATRAAGDGLGAALAALAAGDVEAGRTELAALPGSASPAAAGTAGGGAEIAATLVFRRPRRLALAAEAVERAAALAPLVWRLAEALAPPAAERTPGRALGDALTAVTEQLGAGALDLGALALGDYGVDAAPPAAGEDAGVGAGESEGLADGAGGDDDAPPERGAAPPAALVALLVQKTVAAARARAAEIELAPEELDAVLPAAAAPPTAELFLAPCRPRPGAPPGTGWLYGLHAPAGASWGRFAFALGAGADPLLEELRRAEARARPGEEALDLVFAPSAALGDLCVHPRVRRRALALGCWPSTDGAAALVPADLELVADPAAPEPLALRTRAGQPVSPAPLHRVRSGTAPPGVWRLLAGWRLYRQHAPWAAVPGPLFDLDWTPRIAVGGFVVAPASWRVPREIAARDAPAGALGAWRRRARLPRWVQVGHEDELLPVDLAARDAAADLAGAERVFEIWPPLGDTADADGRRIEAVVALCDAPASAEEPVIASAIAAAAGAGAVPPPRQAAAAGRAAAAGWRTFKLYGATERQDPVLLGVVWPVVQAARVAGEIDGWFFLRYVEGPGRRPHLRLRIHHDSDGGGGRARLGFEHRLDEALAPAVEAGDVTAVEISGYFPEAARLGGAATLPAVHALWEAESELGCALLAIPPADGDGGEDAWPGERRLALLVSTLDLLAGAFRLDPRERRELARRRRRAHAADVTPDLAGLIDREFRRSGRAVRAALAAGGPPEARAPLGAFARRAAEAAASVGATTRDQVLPALLHLAAVRQLGADPTGEIRGYTFWERAREGLERHPGAAKP